MTLELVVFVFVVVDEEVVGVDQADEAEEDFDVGVDVFLNFVWKIVVGLHFFVGDDARSEAAAGGLEHVSGIFSVEHITRELREALLESIIAVEEEADGKIGIALNRVVVDSCKFTDFGFNFGRGRFLEEAVCTTWSDHCRGSSVFVDASPLLSFGGGVVAGGGNVGVCGFRRSSTGSEVGARIVSIEWGWRLGSGCWVFTVTSTAANEIFAVGSVEEGTKDEVGGCFGKSSVLGGWGSDYLSGGCVFADHREATGGELALAFFSGDCLSGEFSDGAQVFEGEGVGNRLAVSFLLGSLDLTAEIDRLNTENVGGVFEELLALLVESTIFSVSEDDEFLVDSVTVRLVLIDLVIFTGTEEI